MYIPEGETLDRASGETPIERIAAERWQILSAKNATGRPRMVFADRGGTVVTAKFWPIPDEAGTVRLQVHELSADTLEGNKTVDAERYWAKYLLFELASYLCPAKSR